MRLLSSTFLAAILLCFLQSCTSPRQPQTSNQTANQGPANPDATRLITQLENSIAEHLFQQAFDETIARSPERQTYLGIKDNDNQWTDGSSGYLEESLAITNSWWQKISNDIDYKQLNRQNKLSYQLLEYNTAIANQQYRFRFHNYPVNQSNGLHARVPSFLINIHPSSSVTDLEAYIARLENTQHLVGQLIKGLKEREKLGIVPPKFVIPQVISDSRNILSGRPFEFSKQDSVLLDDFKMKVNNQGLIDSKRQQLVAGASTAMIESVKPAYSTLIDYLLELDQNATNDVGVWQLPDGREFYLHQLRFHTTTEMTPEQVHNLGLAEVTRIQAEMLEVLHKVNFDGNLQEFFKYLQQDSRFYFPNSEQGKQAYLSRTVDILGGMNERLNELFFSRPTSGLIVKAIDPFSERSAGASLYSAPAADGSRPGIFYLNLYDMSDTPIYELEAQAYHEGIPGRHLERSLTQKLANIPDFRRFGSYTAFTAGWSLYMEYMPKELGLYSDPYSDFGRLARELWYACGLVADTGIHWKRWTLEQAIEYLDSNTARTHSQNVKAVEQYAVRPGLATAYNIGMLKFLELQGRARDSLGEDFDIREYHQVVLANGPLPLALLETVVDEWIKATAQTLDSQE